MYFKYQGIVQPKVDVQETSVDYWINIDFHTVSAKKKKNHLLSIPRDDDVNLNRLHNILLFS